MRIWRGVLLLPTKIATDWTMARGLSIASLDLTRCGRPGSVRYENYVRRLMGPGAIAVSVSECARGRRVWWRGGLRCRCRGGLDGVRSESDDIVTRCMDRMSD